MLSFLRITDVWKTSVFSCVLSQIEKKPFFGFLVVPARERIGETTPRSHQRDDKRVPQPREKPAASKTPLQAAKKLPTCQPLWQPLLARPRAPGREEATTALLTFLAQRSSVACRAVTTPKTTRGSVAQPRPCGRRSYSYSRCTHKPSQRRRRAGTSDQPNATLRAPHHKKKAIMPTASRRRPPSRPGPPAPSRRCRGTRRSRCRRPTRACRFCKL